jgi:hypothetical protein
MLYLVEQITDAWTANDGLKLEHSQVVEANDPHHAAQIVQDEHPDKFWAFKPYELRSQIRGYKWEAADGSLAAMFVTLLPIGRTQATQQKGTET